MDVYGSDTAPDEEAAATSGAEASADVEAGSSGAPEAKLR